VEPRRVRTYHARNGRLSARKRTALDTLGPHYALRPAAAPQPAWRLAGRTDRPAPTLVEIGAGTGEAALAFAAAHPGWVVIACEVHAASRAVLLLDLAAAALPNVAVHGEDAVDLLGGMAEASVDTIRAFFPDPWPKARHRRRRLVQPEFVATAAALLVEGGVLELATDDGAYADQMRAELGACAAFLTEHDQRADRPVTHYEALAQRGGRTVVDLRVRRTARVDQDHGHLLVPGA
jgi:tRNA (guanine-N7-)-methyltransferase